MSVGAASSFYASLVTEAHFLQLISEKTKEGLYLEFKTKKDRSNGKLGDWDKSQFSRALSGFANSDGGVMIWGIATNKREEACDLKPISGIHEFLAGLKKSILHSTQPVVDGVLLEAVSSAENSEEGYLKCFIPSSYKTPHRAMLAEREYFKRTTEGFYRLEHFDLDDMFGRRPRPDLDVIVSPKGAKSGEVIEEIGFGLINNGRGLARYSSIFCSVLQNANLRRVAGEFQNVSALNGGRPVFSYDSGQAVVHPNGIIRQIGSIFLQRNDMNQAIRLKIVMCCEGMAARTDILDIPV